jgi:two-component system, NtrC family, response regulator AtoC
MGLTILIIDDEPHLPYQLARFLRKHSYEVLVAPDGETGLRVLQNNIVDLILLDLRLPRVGGLEVLSSVRKSDTELPAVMITAYGDVQSAVAAMKQGAADYLLKGFDLDELLLVVKRALEKSAMARELRQLRRERNAHYHLDYIVGHSERMREVFEFITRIASSEASVLITGESGTGKEVVARAIHEQSQRASGPFHPLNCAAISHTLLESELFGFEQYAFTDAKKQKRVLETHSFFRLGGNKEVKINVRVLAATNRDLEQAMKEGTFRSDLFFRLAVLNIKLPPLRERPDDIMLFAARFVERATSGTGLARRFERPCRAARDPLGVRNIEA